MHLNLSDYNKECKCFKAAVDGVTMGSPLGPVLANIFMCDFEEKWLMNAKISPLVCLFFTA